MPGPKLLRPAAVPATITPPLPSAGLSEADLATLRGRYTYQLPPWAQSLSVLADLLPTPLTVAGGSATLPGFYSRLERAVATLPATAHPSKVLSVAKNATSGEEIAWRGLDQFLAGKGNAPVAKEEVLGWLAEHPLDVQRIEYGRPTRTTTFDEWYDATHLSPFSELSPGAQEIARREYISRGQLVPPADYVAPRHGKWQVAGGKDYRETLLTLKPSQPPPATRPSNETMTTLEARAMFQRGEPIYWFRHADHTVVPIQDLRSMSAESAYAQDVFNGTAEWRRGVVDSTGMVTSPHEFRSTHWSEPNVLVHARSNERTLPGAGKGRFLEEVQSDWHQQGKKQGYVNQELARQADQINAELQDIQQKLTAIQSQAAQGRAPVGVSANDLLTRRQQLLASLEDVIKRQGAIPDAPFKESWPDLALKQQLLDVANRPDLDWIGFTSGETQAARYDLSKHVSQIQYNPESKMLIAWDHDNARVIEQPNVTPEKLADYIGKEPAEKLLNLPPARVVPATSGERPFAVVDSHNQLLTAFFSQRQAEDYARMVGQTLSGLDLKVGGEGMRKFYDELLVKRMEKLVNPFGGKVERAGIPTTEHAKVPAFTVIDQHGNQRGEFYTRAEAEAYLRNAPDFIDVARSRIQEVMGSGRRFKQEPIWIVRLTPEMKTKIRETGFPLAALLPPVVTIARPSSRK